METPKRTNIFIVDRVVDAVAYLKQFPEFRFESGNGSKTLNIYFDDDDKIRCWFLLETADDLKKLNNGVIMTFEEFKQFLNIVTNDST